LKLDINNLHFIAFQRADEETKELQFGVQEVGVAKVGVATVLEQELNRQAAGFMDSNRTFHPKSSLIAANI